MSEVAKISFNISEEDNALRHAVAETWISKDFADVEVLCGVDGGIVLTHRIILVRNKHSQLSKCSTARGSGSGLSVGGPTKVKAHKSFLFTEGSL